ncbi:hypothetical protein AB0N88_20205 [Streptomyces sp. NPDC093516]|uniref:hypothetical protein n=1 Tax=Streptomyces sp. NPDC093516 TaxID=3155304 RepID=UPI00341DA971
MRPGAEARPRPRPGDAGTDEDAGSDEDARADEDAGLEEDTGTGSAARVPSADGTASTVPGSRPV